MYSINNILAATDHRPWPLSQGKWTYYQEWNRALFLHWKVPAQELRSLLPSRLSLDLHEGEAWVSLVAFTMEKISPRGVPAFSPISTFDEINVRTYVTHDNKPGVYFLNIEAGKYLSAHISRSLSGLPYEYALIERQFAQTGSSYTSTNKAKGFTLSASFTIGAPLQQKSSLDQWLTERYCLYLEANKTLYRYDIHHKPWELSNIQVRDLQVTYRIGNIVLQPPPDLIHYSSGVQVLAWKREKI